MRSDWQALLYLQALLLIASFLAWSWQPQKVLKNSGQKMWYVRSAVPNADNNGQPNMEERYYRKEPGFRGADVGTVAVSLNCSAQSA